MGQIESAIDAARRSGHGKSGPWEFRASSDEGVLIHYGTPIFKVNLRTGAGEVGAGAWGSVSDQTGIRKAAAHLSNVLGGTVSVKALAKKEIIAARERARSKGAAFSNPAAKRLAHGHALLPDGKIYCSWQGDQAAPVVTHSGVKCSFCGKTVQSMHEPSKNPARKTQVLYKKFLISKDWESGIFKVIQGGEVVGQFPSMRDAKNAVDRVASGQSVFYKSPPWKSNPSRKHISADIRAFDRVTREMKTLKARDKRELRRKNPLPPVPGKVVNEAGKVYLHYKSINQLAKWLLKQGIGDWATVGGLGWSFVPWETPTSRAQSMLAQEYAKHLDREIHKKNPVPSYALLLRRALAKGHDFESAQDIANRQLQQAAEFLRAPYTESRRRNPASGLRRDGPTKIYGRTEKIFMTKTEGPYKGERFVHTFKPGVEQHGLPRGTVLTFPGGEKTRLTTKSVLMTGKKDIWGNFPA